VLDERPARTPGGAALVLPVRALARALAAEWRAQDTHIRPDSMPLTRFANTAIDRVATRRDAVIDELAGYAETDLLCYRVAFPVALVRRQEEAWQPLLDWAAAQCGATLRVTHTATPVAQDADAVAALRAAIAAHEDFALAALHGLCACSGSVVLALAVAAGAIDARAAANASLLEESWQAENWGEEDEAAARRIAIRAEIAAAARFLSLL